MMAERLMPKPSPSVLVARQERAAHLASFDAAFRATKTTRLAGVDEVGMGTLAGPVVAAAVILPRDQLFVGVDDSKKVSATRRKVLAHEICTVAQTFVGQASVSEINELGIARAGRLAMRRAVDGLEVLPDIVLVDARTLELLPLEQHAIVGGDRKSLCIAAASIVAKVARDAMMCRLDEKFPQYRFAAHKGYGTRLHLEALQEHGATPHHRRNFGPVARILRASVSASARSALRTNAR